MLHMLVTVMMTVWLSLATGVDAAPGVVAGAAEMHPGGVAGLMSDTMHVMMQMTAGLGALYASWRAAKERRRRRRRPRQPMRTYERSSWQSTFLDRLNPLEFRRMFGLTQPAFDALLEDIHDDIVDKPGTWGGVRNGAAVPPALKLALTLRWLRGGSHHDLRLLFGVSKPTIYRVVVRVMRVICAHKELPLPAAAAAAAAGDDSMLKKLALGFGRHTLGIFGACVGAIDGVQVSPRRE